MAGRREGKLYGLEDFITTKHLENMGKVMLATGLIVAYGYMMEAFGGMLFSQQAVLNIIPNLRLILFGVLIIVFLVVEPEGLNRLWRNIRSYFRVWPFAY